MATEYARAKVRYVSERFEAILRRGWGAFLQVVRRPMGTAGLATILVFVGMAALAPAIAGPFPQFSPPVNISTPNLPPSPGFPLGTDSVGRSNFVLLVYGARISLLVGLASSLVAMILGTAVGIVGGYYGRLPDRTLSWVTNFFLVIPWLPFVLVMKSVLEDLAWWRQYEDQLDALLPGWFPPGFLTTIVAISIVSWPTTARVVRSKVLSLKTLGYVQRARAIGARDRHIMWRHLMPGLAPLIFANMILTVSTSVWTESFLAFFGLGSTTRPSWGTMIQRSWTNLDFIRGAYWSFLPPGICVTALVLAFTMVSHVLEEILNPKLRQR